MPIGLPTDSYWERCARCGEYWVGGWCNACQSSDWLRAITDAELAVIKIGGWEAAEAMPRE